MRAGLAILKSHLNPLGEIGDCNKDAKDGDA
jgi:hypothetical protein